MCVAYRPLLTPQPFHPDLKSCKPKHVNCGPAEPRALGYNRTKKCLQNYDQK